VVVISHLQGRERGECGCPWPAHGHGEMGAAWALDAVGEREKGGCGSMRGRRLDYGC